MTPAEQEMARQGLESLRINWYNLYVQIAIAAGALIVAILAIWGDYWRGLIFAPKLKVSVQLTPPFCQRFSSGDWFRLKVENASSTTARDVEIWITELREKRAGTLLPRNLAPIPLRWTHTGNATAPSINPLFHRYCDFGALRNSSTSHWPHLVTSAQIWLDLLTTPVPVDALTKLQAGTYQVQLTATCADSGPRIFELEFNVPDFWPPTEEDSLSAVWLHPI